MHSTKNKFCCVDVFQKLQRRSILHAYIGREEEEEKTVCGTNVDGVGTYVQRLSG